MTMNLVFNNTQSSIHFAILLHASDDASNRGSAYIIYVLPAFQLGAYGLTTLLVTSVLLLICTCGSLSNNPDLAVQPVAVPQPAELS
jgi:hypothetical protein